MAVGREQRPEPGLHRSRQRRALDRATVDREEDLIRVRPLDRRRRDKARDPAERPRAFDGNQGGPELGAVKRGDRLEKARPRRGEARPPVVGEREPDLRSGECEPFDRPREVRDLGPERLLELLPRRRVEEEVLDRHARAHRRGGLALLLDKPAADHETVREQVPRLPRDQREPAHGGDRGEGLAAEAHGRDRGELVRAAELRGRVRQDGEPQVLGRHPGAVVGDADRRDRAGVRLHRDRDPRGAGVERVLDELLRDRGRPLDHLAGRDLRDRGRVEGVDGAHRHGSTSLFSR